MPAQGAADARASHHGWRLHRRGRILQPRPGERRPDQARPARARRENRVCAFRRRSLVESVRRQPRQRRPHRRHGERHVHVDACGRCQRAARAPVLRGRLVPFRFETGLAPPTSAPGLGAPLPHLRRDWAHPCHICAGTGRTPATSGRTPATSAPGLGSPPPVFHYRLRQYFERAEQGWLRYRSGTAGYGIEHKCSARVRRYAMQCSLWRGSVVLQVSLLLCHP